MERNKQKNECLKESKERDTTSIYINMTSHIKTYSKWKRQTFKHLLEKRNGIIWISKIKMNHRNKTKGRKIDSED